MKPTRTILALFVAVLALPMAAVGQDENASIRMASNDETNGNVAGAGQKSRAALRRDVFQAEEDFYSLYNKFNDDKEYDVKCFYETPTGTHQKNHVCRARFITNAYERHARRNRNNLTRVANQDADPILIEKTAKYQENLEALLAANPELQSALARYNTLRAQYMANGEENGSR